MRPARRGQCDAVVAGLHGQIVEGNAIVFGVHVQDVDAVSADHGQGVNAGAVGVDAFTGLRGGDGGPPFSREYVGDLGAGLPVRVRGADNDRNPCIKQARGQRGDFDVVHRCHSSSFPPRGMQVGSAAAE